jgi:hypothetical protein
MTLKRLERRENPTGCITRNIHGSRMRLHLGPAGGHSLERTLALGGTREPASTEFYTIRKEIRARDASRSKRRTWRL